MVRLKGVCYAVFARDSSEFQFLMVRLKAAICCAFGVFLLFQFLMVRLKENMMIKFINSYYQFQFLMVRLKVLLIVFIILNL